MSIKTARDGRETGDWTQPELQSAVLGGKVLPSDLVWMPGWTEWKILADVAAELDVQFRPVEAVVVAKGTETKVASASAKSDSNSGCLTVIGALFLLGLAFKAFTFLASGGGSSSLLTDGSESSRAAAIYSSSGSDALSKVTPYATGTWTYTEPGSWWFRIVVSEDGSARYMSVRPSNDSWGEGIEGKIHPWTGKDGSTGKRFYGFLFKTEESDAGLHFLIDPDGGLVFATEKIRMVRRDVSPFAE